MVYKIIKLIFELKQKVKNSQTISRHTEIFPYSKNVAIQQKKKQKRTIVSKIQCSPLKVNSLGPEKSVHFIQGSL